MEQNKIAVCEFSFPNLGPVNIELASRAGFDGVQLIDSWELSPSVPLLNPYIRAAYMEAAEKWNIAFPSLHLYALCHADIMGSDLNSAAGELIKFNLRSAVETCKLMGIPAIMVNFNPHHLSKRPCLEQWDNATAALKYGYELCEDNGVQMTIETLHSPEAFFRLREKVGDNLKICFDTMIPMVHGTGIPVELLKGYGIDAVDHFHVHDANPDPRGYWGMHLVSSALIGEGQSGFRDCAEVINASGFRGWFVSETVYTNPAFYKGMDISNGMDYVAMAKRDVQTLRDTFVK